MLRKKLFPKYRSIHEKGVPKREMRKNFFFNLAITETVGSNATKHRRIYFNAKVYQKNKSLTYNA